MVQIQNTDAVEAIRNGARLSISEGFPTQLGSIIAPVIDMTPRFHRILDVIARVGAGASGTTTVYTTSTIKEFFLTNLSFSYSKDATNENATSMRITATVAGVSVTLLSVAVQATTADQSTVVVAFQRPIKIDKGTNIQMTGTFSLGVLSRDCCVQGYEVNP